jgi:hypothetical protein
VAEGPEPCARCRQPVDGTEQSVCIDGETVWLHPGCQNAYAGVLDIEIPNFLRKPQT